MRRTDSRPDVSNGGNLDGNGTMPSPSTIVVPVTWVSNGRLLIATVPETGNGTLLTATVPDTVALPVMGNGSGLATFTLSVAAGACAEA